MSDPREPIDLIEITLPRCALTYGVGACTATGAPGTECYNTRATCQDPDNYSDLPDKRLSRLPTAIILGQGETISPAGLQRGKPIFIGVEVFFPLAPSGVILEAGNATNGLYIGVTAGSLVFAVDAAQVSVDATPYIGKTMTIYAEVDFAANSTSTLRLWAFDPIERAVELLGETSFTAGAWWAANSDGGVGYAEGTTIAGVDTTDWTGFILSARLHPNTNAPSTINDPDAYRSALWLGRGRPGEPRDEVPIIPALASVETISTRLNPLAMDRNYKPLGRRASLAFRAEDFTHSDIGQDPYLDNRPFDPKTRGTFWGKWLVRQKYGKLGALVRWHSGYAGQRLTDYTAHTFVLDNVGKNETQVEFRCRDILSLTDFDKAKVPAVSKGKLQLKLPVTNEDGSEVTAFRAAGDVSADYPQSGIVRIEDELIRYDGVQYFDAAVPTYTEFTVVERGAFRTEVKEHAKDTLIQLCRQYTQKPAKDVILELLVNDARIPGQFIDVQGLVNEYEQYLYSYDLSALLTKPQAVGELIGAISAECAFFTWWDEREQLIRIKAIRPTDVSDIITRWTNEDNIIAGSFRVAEKPDQRISLLTIYYDPIYPTKDEQKPENYAKALTVVYGEAGLAETYGDVVQERTLFARFLTTEPQVNQTGTRAALRFRDTPRYVEFHVDAKDRAVWVGDVVELSHPEIAGATGEREIRRWVIVEAEEVDPGHVVRYVAADITLDGLIYRITDNSVTSYDPELFEQGFAFITDNNGFNPDGSEGARVG